MIKEDFERALRAYDLAARRSPAEGTEATNGVAPLTNKPSLLQYLARASYHLGLQTKSYTLLKQSIEYFDQALIQLEQRASSGAVAEGKYVRYNIAVTHQKILQMLFDLPVEERQLSVLEEAVEGIAASQETFKSLLPDAQADKLASITAEIVEQR
jgi:RNA polymerase-associated protein CTR9